MCLQPFQGKNAEINMKAERNNKIDFISMQHNGSGRQGLPIKQKKKGKSTYETFIFYQRKGQGHLTGAAHASGFSPVV